MSSIWSSPTRRGFVAATGAVGPLVANARAAGDPPSNQASHQRDSPMSTAQNDAIRPFHIDVSDEALADLRRRIAATTWPEQELVADATQGVQLATMRELARYWQTDYDWRKVEARLNALPQFITNIDGLDIHFIHVRSKNPKIGRAHV